MKCLMFYSLKFETLTKCVCDVRKKQSFNKIIIFEL